MNLCLLSMIPLTGCSKAAIMCNISKNNILGNTIVQIKRLNTILFQVKGLGKAKAQINHLGIINLQSISLGNKKNQTEVLDNTKSQVRPAGIMTSRFSIWENTEKPAGFKLNPAGFILNIHHIAAQLVTNSIPLKSLGV